MTIESSGLRRDKDLRGERRIENLQGLRGVAILLVLFYHIGKYLERRHTGNTALSDFTFLGRSGVDLFFVISGFVMATITRGKFQRPDGTKTFWLRRAGRIYPLYWIYTLILLPIFFWRPDLMNRPEGSDGISLLRSFLLLPHSQAPLLGQGWTLVYELYFYFMFGLILLRPEREKGKILGAWAAVLLTGTILNATTGFATHSAILQHLVNPLTFEFIIGCFLAMAVDAGTTRGAFPALVVGALLLPVTLLVPADWLPAPRDWKRVLEYALPAGLLVYGAVAAEIRLRFILPRALRFVGDISYSTYLSHMLVISVLSRGLPKSPSVLMDTVLFVVVALTGVIAAGSASYFFVEKPLLNYAYKLIPRLIAWKQGAESKRLRAGTETN